MEKALIIGAGSVGGHLALNIKNYCDHLTILGFLDDDQHKIGKVLFGYCVLGNVGYIKNFNDEISIIVGIAAPNIKEHIFRKLQSKKNFNFPAMVSKNAWISESVQIGDGSIIYPGVSINYESAIGKFVTVNMNCALGHHTIIGDFVSLAPGVNTSGHVTIQAGCDVGIGVCMKQGVIVGEKSIIGGQAMLIQNVPPNSKIGGVPGRVIQ